jgi:murein DD-endopeptidase MepM/ murein hydrolase activator NlpD
MRRRSHSAIALVALLMVGTSIVSPSPRDQAQAADPLADAKAEQQALERTLSQQRVALAQLKATSAALTARLGVAEAELASVTAEYFRVAGLLVQVQADVADITAHLADLRAQIATVDQQLNGLAVQIRLETTALHEREALLQDHLRTAYERSQTSLLEIIISAPTLDAATTQVSYLITVSGQDQQLAADINSLRAELQTEQETLRAGRASLGDARDQAQAEAAQLAAREQELADMQAHLAELKQAAEQKRQAQADALNGALVARGQVEAQIKAAESAFAAQTALVNKLQAEADARYQNPSAFGFRWPENHFVVTQEWGPTSFVLEPPYTYNGVYYPNFHTGIDIANGCGTPIYAVGAGTVKASGQPAWPWDTAYGVLIDDGFGVLSDYWHLQARVIVYPGQHVSFGQLIGYEGMTGTATGCHLHFAINDHGIWQNPRNYLP